MSGGQNTQIVSVGVDLVEALLKVFNSRAIQTGPAGEILADVSGLLPVIQKRFIDKVPYTEAEAHDLLAYIGVVENPGT